jgi:glycosyltransferase involved in cell wall biosynthesis
VNLLVFNLAMDADDSVHGHTTAWTNALARRCESVSVITMRAGRIEVEDNVSVHSLGKERGLSEPRRLRRFYGLVRSIMGARRIDACFAHMAPLFTVLFAPVAKRSGIPVVLWYAHTSVTPTLRMAHALADRCLTSTPAGFRIPSKKLFVVGQGVDLEQFRPPTDNGPPYDRTVLTVGRITPVKRLEEMIDAIAILRGTGMDLDLKLFGAPFATDDRRYESSLRQRATERELNGHVSFEGAMPFHEVQTAYHAGGLFLNLSETGSIDKAILESMASGCIPVSRNSSFREVAREHGLEWLVPGPGPREVAERIADVMRRPKDERAALAGRMREIVAADHSLDRLSYVSIGHLRELSERAGAPR